MVCADAVCNSDRHADETIAAAMQSVRGTDAGVFMAIPPWEFQRPTIHLNRLHRTRRDLCIERTFEAADFLPPPPSRGVSAAEPRQGRALAARSSARWREPLPLRAACRAALESGDE